MSILLVEEKVPFTLALADRLYFMVKGRVEHTATREELEGKKDIFVRYLAIDR
jgi:ABC-type branched-subunit amino acid transport system ATPase component